MYIRITYYQMNPANIDDIVALMPGVKEKVSKITGLINCTTSWKDDGQGCTTAVYENKEAADSGAKVSAEIWGGLAQYLTAEPTIEEYENGVDFMN